MLKAVWQVSSLVSIKQRLLHAGRIVLAHRMQCRQHMPHTDSAFMQQPDKLIPLDFL